MKTLYLNTKFISLNEYINLERKNKFAAASIKKSQTNKVIYLAIEQEFTLDQDKKYDVVFNWFKPNNKKDHDNICFAKKFILDGLVSAKILKSDGAKHIGNFQDNFFLDKDRPYVSCTVLFRECK